MMEKKKILEEGLLEKYLLNELTAVERIAVEKALENDLELKQQFDALEMDFEQMAFENAVQPNESIKKVLQEQLQSTTSNRKNSISFMAAAGLALLFLLSAFFLYNKWQETENNLNLIRSQTLSLQQRIELLEKNNQVTNDLLKFINGPNTIPLVLLGNDKALGSRAVAYVNHSEKSVMVNVLGLSKLPKNQTYQIWSDVDGEMISMGLLPPDEELVPVKYIDKAASLNITIEPIGGSEHATVENLVSFVTF